MHLRLNALSLLLLVLIFNLLLVHSVEAASATATSVVSKLTPTTYGQAATFVATVTGGVPNGERVTFYDSGASIGTNLTSSGKAALLVTSLSAGSHTITATYSGDANFASSTSSFIVQTVKPASTYTSLVSSISASSYGQSVGFVATITGNVPNGETVTVYDGFTPIGTVFISAGSASFNISTLSAGVHSIKATYVGDANLVTSTSNTIAQTVKTAATSISLTSIYNGRSVVLTAAISPNAIPNGETVTFKDGSTTIGIAKTSSGLATLTTNSILSGTHSITAAYSGDANLTAATSSTLVLTNGVPLTTTIRAPSCLLGINLTSGSPYYVAPQGIALYYSVRTLRACSVPLATGTLSLTSATTGAVYESIPVNITNIISTPVTRVAYLNSTNAPAGGSLAVLLLTVGSVSNLSTTSFYVLQPANITVGDIEVASGNNTFVGSPISIISNVLNSAGYGASNASMNLKIVSPDLSVYRTTLKMGSIPAFRNSTVVISPATGGIPKLPGRYVVLENVSFYSNYTTPNGVYTSSILYSNTTATQYNANPNRNSGYNISAGYPTPPPNIGPVMISSFPLYTDIISDNATSNLNALGFYDSAAYPVTLNLSLPTLPFGRLTPSTNFLIIQPNQTATVQFRFTPAANTTGLYQIPMNVSASGRNNITTAQLYMILHIKLRPNRPYFLNSERLLNGNKNASVQLSVLNPSNVTSYSLFMYTNLNSSVTGTKNGIALTGSLANLSLSSSTYTLGWHFSRLFGNASVQAGYNVSNVIQPRYFLIPPLFLSSTFQSNLTVLSILGIIKPTGVYPNSTVQITVSAVYTGQNVTTVTLTLMPPTGANVINPQQSFRVTPNSAIDAKFQVRTGQYPGNETFVLVTPGAFTSHRQSISLNVLAVPVKTFTLYDYLADPRTIFGALTLVIYLSVLVYRRATKAYTDRKLRASATVRNIDQLRELDKKINVAIVEEGPRKRTFRRHANRDGGAGGFVEDSAVVGEDVTIGPTAIVEDEPIVSGGVKILNNATVSDHAVLRSKVIISGSAKVGDDAELYGNAQVYENAKVFGQCEVYDDVKIYGRAQIFGDAHVFGEAQVSGTAKIYGSAQVSGDAHILKGDMHKGEHV